eukprot:CAMPEP_0113652778 /NCGR_PEP_ID=MMETSP0017_2-20120614/28205_1 /TAXON_ID=2856 /ORGANISM="Cylindrotheca closterium" /LENGTH=74 /DNA_ID=CAMNT_0000565683 /DNA_START=253 /DNA_END=477 /DNA_ORIENTATION=+ /assembly_acc=CAM_ASM_000147
MEEDLTKVSNKYVEKKLEEKSLSMKGGMRKQVIDSNKPLVLSGKHHGENLPMAALVYTTPLAQRGNHKTPLWMF